MIFSILQVSRDRERLLTASVQHFVASVRRFTRFVSCRNVTGFAVTLPVTYSKTDSVELKDASA